jgi:hypothetical protein
MNGEFRLVPLDCPACGAPLAAESEDVVFYCTACRTGYRYDPGAPRSLAPVEVSFMAAPTAREVAGHLPFWLLPARVELLRRDASGGLVSGLMGLLTGAEQGGTSGAGVFAVPAFRLPVERAVRLTQRYTFESPGLGELLGERLTGGLFSPDDAEKLAHFALITAEAEKSDTLKDLDYRIDFGPPRLLGVPWMRRGEGRVDALFGLALD